MDRWWMDEWMDKIVIFPFFGHFQGTQGPVGLVGAAGERGLKVKCSRWRKVVSVVFWTVLCNLEHSLCTPHRDKMQRKRCRRSSKQSDSMVNAGVKQRLKSLQPTRVYIRCLWKEMFSIESSRVKVLFTQSRFDVKLCNCVYHLFSNTNSWLPPALPELLSTSSPQLVFVHHQNYVATSKAVILCNVTSWSCYHQGLPGLPGDQGLIGLDGPQVGEAFRKKYTIRTSRNTKFQLLIVKGNLSMTWYIIYSKN